MYSTLSESGTEAKGINDELKKELYMKRQLGQEGEEEFKDFANLTDDDIKSRAGEAAANVFK